MGLTTLISMFAGVGLLFTLITIFFKKHKTAWMTFLQHFCGVWFVFSGAVKAVDPIGTAYKMEEYFQNFETTFAGSKMSFLAPLFPFLNGFGNGFSIFMIVLEIVLGLMLIIGLWNRLTAWLFFTIVVFFTALTGFTYLTGFVPTEANFFDFSKWGDFVKSQMRVTDCGCFGDFIKLDPRISFYKDVFLLIPAFLFLLFTRKMHKIGSSQAQMSVFGLATLGCLVFSYSNTYWREPIVDFRPFHEGSDLRTRKKLEEEARTNVEIIGWMMENDSLNKIVEVMDPEYGNVAKLYPKDQGWKVKEQIQSELTVPQTKISDFSLTAADGSDVGDRILGIEAVSMVLVAYHFEGRTVEETITVQDTTWASDTIRVTKDSIAVTQRMVEVKPVQKVKKTFKLDPEYLATLKEKIMPLAIEAEKAGYKVYGMASVQDQDYVDDFKQQIGFDYAMFIGDDKLLKTILRSNPGVVFLKDGVLLKKYHQRHIPSNLPSF